jgi:hypothetical protein
MSTGIGSEELDVVRIFVQSFLLFIYFSFLVVCFDQSSQQVHQVNDDENKQNGNETSNTRCLFTMILLRQWSLLTLLWWWSSLSMHSVVF